MRAALRSARSLASATFAPTALPRVRFAPAAFAALAVLAAATSGSAAPPRVEGKILAHVAVTVAPDASGTVHVPGPFAVLPGNRRVALCVPEADGILLLEGDRIVHHFPIEHSAQVQEVEASDSLLVAGRRPRGGPYTVHLLVFDLHSGRLVTKIESTNPYIRAPENGRDPWRIVVDEERVGVFHPPAAASYPLWDRASGQVIGGDQMAQATTGLGFGANAVWIPNPDGSVDLKVPGHPKRLADAGEGEFVGGSGDVVVLLQDASDAEERLLPNELVVHVLESDRAIAERRLVAVSPDVPAARRIVSGRPVQVRNGRLYWVFLGPDFLEIRSTELPAAAAK